MHRHIAKSDDFLPGSAIERSSSTLDVKHWIALMASRMSARYSRSLRMNYFGIEHDLVADVAVEAVSRKQVGRTAKYPHQFVTHPLQRHESDPRIRGQIDQHIDIAVRAEIIPNGRAEDRKLPHGMSSAEVAYCGMGDSHLWIHFEHRTFCRSLDLPSMPHVG